MSHFTKLHSLLSHSILCFPRPAFPPAFFSVNPVFSVLKFPLAFLLTSTIALAAKVDVVLLTESSGVGTQVQQWYRLFTDLKVDSLQIRGPQGNEKIEVVNLGTAQNPSYRIIGQLTSRNEIVMPNGRYKLSDRARLGDWLSSLRSGAAAKAAAGPPPPFGVPPELLAAVRREFAAPIDFETKDQPLKSVLAEVAKKLKTPLVIDPSAAAGVASSEVLHDDLRNLATGAGLAAALRPAGLVFVPRLNSRKQVELAVTAASQQGAAFWPIGWAPTAERPENQIVPEMHEVRDIELDEVPVMELIAAVAERLKTPVLIDHNGLARQGIDPSKARVSMPPGRSTYALVLGRMLAKAKLKYEVRIDDAGKPFLWIMSYI